MRGLIYILLSIFTILAFVNISMAQRSTSATMEVRVRVVDVNKVDGFQPFNNTAIGKESIAEQQSGRLGKAGFRISGEPGGQVLVKLPESIDLTDDNGKKIRFQTNKPHLRASKTSRYHNNHQDLRSQSGGNVRLDEKTGKASVHFGGHMDLSDWNKEPSSNASKKNNVFKGNYIARVEYP